MKPAANRQTSDADGVLDHLLEEIADKLQKGEPLELADYQAAYPEHAERLASLFAAVRALAQLSGTSLRATLGPAASFGDGQRGRLGDFEILRELGRGGMGVVYEAEQLSLSRRVALKVLPFAAMLDDRRLQRFKNEAHAAAVLQHPHIVPVYGVGCERGVHYYAMQLIDGCSLADALAERSLGPGVRAGDCEDVCAEKAELPTTARESCAAGDRPLRDPPSRRTSLGNTAIVAAGSTLRDPADRNRFLQIAELGIQAATALAYAHGQGVVHRDIKPSNLLIDRTGKLWVTDFGLARLQVEGHELTLTGDVLGTLRYMSPEQLTGEQIVDERSDVYSLGLTLYELMAGRVAFGEAARERLIAQILKEDPPSLRKIDAAIPRDLETIVAKAVYRDRDGRYASAQALADDLERFSQQRPIHARPSGRAEIVARWTRRNPIVAALGTALAVVMTLLAAVAVVSSWELANVAHRERSLRSDTAVKLRAADMNRAKHAIDRGDLAGALALLHSHEGEPGGFESDYLAELCRTGASARVLPHSTQVMDVTFAPIGNLLSTSTFRNEFQLWDHSRGETIWHESSFGVQVTRTVFRQGGRQLVTASRDGAVRVWDVATRSELCRFEDHELDAWAMDVSPANGVVAIGYSERYVHYPNSSRAKLVVWDPERNKVVYATSEFPEKVMHLKFSPDGRVLAMATYGTYVRLFDASTWQELPHLGPHSSGVCALAFRDDGAVLATAGGIGGRRSLLGEIKLWNTADWGLLATYHGHTRKVYGLVFLRDNRTLLSVAEDSTVSSWDTADLERRKPLRTVLAHSGAMWDVDVSADGKVVGTAGTDNAVRLWSAAELALKPENPIEREDYARGVLDLAFADGGRLTCASVLDGTVIVQDAASGKIVRSLVGRLGLGVWQFMAVSDRAGLVAVRHSARGDERSAVTVYDLRTGQVRWEHCPPDGEEHCDCLAFDLAGRYLAVGGLAALDLIDVETGKLRHRISLQDREVLKTEFSPDGQLLACATGGRTHLFETSAWTEVAAIKTDAFFTNALDFSPDSAYLATGGSDGVIKVWDLATGALAKSCPAHSDHISSVEYSPDGHRLLSAGKDRTVRICDPASGECLLTLNDHDGWVFRARWSPDGKTVASCGEDRTVILRNSAPSRSTSAE